MYLTELAVPPAFKTDITNLKKQSITKKLNPVLHFLLRATDEGARLVLHFFFFFFP
jgi:hypothetical protein